MRKTSSNTAVMLTLFSTLCNLTGAADAATTVTPRIESGSIITFWPFVDYRSNPAGKYSNLSILGPLFKQETSGNTTRTALRPLFFNSTTGENSETDILYPLASTGSSNSTSNTQVLKLFQKNSSRTGSSQEKTETMLFPFYISGKSEKYGEYSSFFPLYGDIYERFWRDEYHYALFPLYGRTVKNGTTSTNILYPFFNVTSGENESGFAVWPLYGKSSKAGVYEKNFALWPFYSHEKLALNSDNPVENINLLPFYASSRSPQRSATYAPWPFCGVVRDGSGKAIERDFFWPFWLTAEGKESSTERFIPFYSSTRIKDSASTWVMWPIYRHQSIDSPKFRQDKTNLLYFFFSHSNESWPELDGRRASSTLWPLYAWKRDEKGIETLSMPALVEPVIWNEGVERNLAPLWRLYISKRADNGDGATSILWNLYWNEQRGKESAWELFPLVSYSSTAKQTDFRLFKGIFGYSSRQGKSTLSLFWLPVAWWQQ